MNDDNHAEFTSPTKRSLRPLPEAGETQSALLTNGQTHSQLPNSILSLSGKLPSLNVLGTLNESKVLRFMSTPEILLKKKARLLILADAGEVKSE